MMVAGMQMAFVDDRQSLGGKRLDELLFHRRLYGHRSVPSPHERPSAMQSACPGYLSRDSAVRAIIAEMSILVSWREHPIIAF
jgi:hypothetical protein